VSTLADGLVMETLMKAATELDSAALFKAHIAQTLTDMPLLSAKLESPATLDTLKTVLTESIIESFRLVHNLSTFLQSQNGAIFVEEEDVVRSRVAEALAAIGAMRDNTLPRENTLQVHRTKTDDALVRYANSQGGS